MHPMRYALAVGRVFDAHWFSSVADTAATRASLALKAEEQREAIRSTHAAVAIHLMQSCGASPMMLALDRDAGAQSALLQWLSPASLHALACSSRQWQRWILYPAVPHPAHLQSRLLTPRDLPLVCASGLAQRYLSSLRFHCPSSDPHAAWSVRAADTVARRLVDFSPLALLPALHTLEFVNDDNWIQFAFAQYRQIAQCRSLTSLRFGDWSCIDERSYKPEWHKVGDPPALRVLLDAMSEAGRQQLRSLNLDRTSMSSVLLAELQRLPALTALAPGFPWELDASAEDFASLGRFAQMQRVRIHFAHESPRGGPVVFPNRNFGDEIVPALAQCRLLSNVDVDFGCSVLSSARLAQLCSFPLLTQLRLHYTRFESLAELALAVRVTGLELSYCSLVDGACTLLAIPAMPELQALCWAEAYCLPDPNDESEGSAAEEVSDEERARRQAAVMARMPKLDKTRVVWMY